MDTESQEKPECNVKELKLAQAKHSWALTDNFLGSQQFSPLKTMAFRNRRNERERRTLNWRRGDVFIDPSAFPWIMSPPSTRATVHFAVDSSSPLSPRVHRCSGHLSVLFLSFDLINSDNITNTTGGNAVLNPDRLSNMFHWSIHFSIPLQLFSHIGPKKFKLGFVTL